jgi:hypothetical protein
MSQAQPGRAVPMPISPQIVQTSCTGIEGGGRLPAACAPALARSLEANSADVQALLAAALAQDTAAPKEILIRHGLTAQQLAGAVIVIRSQTGAEAMPIAVNDCGSAGGCRITVEITCCPLTITIIVSK